MDISRARGTATRRAAPGGRRATTAQGRLSGLSGHVATELERLRRAGGRRTQRSRPDSVIERIKHLV